MAFFFLPFPSVGQEVADNQIDTGDLMECLVQNKHQKEMNEKCAVGVTHFQLVSRLEKCVGFSSNTSYKVANCHVLFFHQFR